MKAAGPSFLAILIALSAGLYLGRSVYPRLDPAALAEQEAAFMARAWEERKTQGHLLVKDAGNVATRLGKKGAAEWPAARKSVAKLPNSSAKAAQWQTLLAFAQVNQLPGVDLAAERQLSPWHALGGPNGGKPAEGPSVRRAQDPSLHSLRTRLAKETDPKAQGEAAAGLGVAQGRVDPLAGLEWLTTLDGELRPAGVLGFAEGWAAIEPLEATSWAVTLVDGLDRDAAARGLAAGAAGVDPLLVLPWALEIVEPGQRLPAVERLLKAAAVADAGLAKELIESAPLGVKERQDYLESLASFTHGISLQQ